MIKFSNPKLQLIFRLFLILNFSLVLIGADGLFINSANAHVNWTITANKVDDSTALIVMKAKIEKDHWIYSINQGEGGPMPTEITFEENQDIEFIEDFVIRGKEKSKQDDVFKMEVKYFEKRITLTRKVKIKTGATKIKGKIDFQICNDKTCFFGDESFNLSLSGYNGTEESHTIDEPTTWKFSINQFSENEAELIATANIVEHWHLYAQGEYVDNGPQPTQFFFDKSDNFELIGNVEARGEVHNEFDKVFDMQVEYFEDEIQFVQKVKIKDPSKSITGKIEFQTCDDEECFSGKTFFYFNIAEGNAGEQELEAGKTAPKFAYKSNTIDTDNPLGNCGDEPQEEESKGLWTIFFLGFVGGLIALLTPCVFPMIPLTVSFFTKSSEDKKSGIKNGILYGFCIFLIYILLSAPFYLLDSIDPNILNTISTDPYLNVFFFGIFLFFAFSFFGYYEITLPSSFVNKMDSASSVGGFVGTFFMALTLALVSFSCTGPILGSLLVGSLTSDGGAVQLTAGMGGFGLALALPFALFAAFPAWLNSLPQSGGWLNVVKVVLGFIELALAFKFLSNSDLVENWGLLKIEPFLAIWIIIGVGLTLYLFGKIKFPHDSPIDKLSKGRLFSGFLALAAVIYLCTGFIYDEENKTFRSLTLLSGLAPPTGYSWIYPNDCPLNLPCFYNDYEGGVAYAKQVGKPIMLDFTGKACVNCRKMEEHVWKVPEIKKIIKEDYVLISLYVDYRKELPENERDTIQTSSGVRIIETVGDKYAAFQNKTFKKATQPYYCLISPDEKLLNNPVAYTPNKNEYKAFLECGLEIFNKNYENPKKEE